MGKITKKQPPKVCGLSTRRIRQIARERLLTDCNLLQSEINSTALKNSDTGDSNVPSTSSNIELPAFTDNRPPSNVENVSSSLISDNDQNSSTSRIENETFEMESNTSDSFILNYDFYDNHTLDSDSEITCNEDTRKTEKEISRLFIYQR